MVGRRTAILALAMATGSIIPVASARAAPVGASRPATGKVSLTRAVGLQKLRDLDFATLTVTTAGTATINPNTDVLNTTGGVLLLTGSPKAAQYRLTTAGLTLLVSINIPTAPITLTRVGGTQTMTVSNWNLEGPSLLILPRAGSYDFRVGGRLNVGANQAEGVYVGTFTVTADYL